MKMAACCLTKHTNFNFVFKNFYLYLSQFANISLEIVALLPFAMLSHSFIVVNMLSLFLFAVIDVEMCKQKESVPKIMATESVLLKVWHCVCVATINLYKKITVT